MGTSGRFDDREDLVGQRDVITIIALLVLILSIVYYMIVFLSELSPTLIGYFVQKLCMEKQVLEEERIRTDSLQIEENPLFSQSEAKIQNTDAIEKELSMTEAKLTKAERQNKELRKKIKKAKQDAQTLAVDMGSTQVK